jgi:hypothetical protein
VASAGSEGAAKKLEMAANVGIIIVALVGVAMLVNNYRQRSQEPKHIPVGARFGLKDVNWQANGKTMVFGISTTCHFCTESAPFYREVVQRCAQQHVKTIAVLPQSTTEAKAYLAGEGVVVDEIRQSALPDLEIGGTPTLLLIDKDGIVRQVWIGKLPGDREKDVLTKVGT